MTTTALITGGLGEFYRIPYVIVRPSAIYGPTEMNRRVSQIFHKKAFLGEAISVHGADDAVLVFPKFDENGTGDPGKADPGDSADSVQ